MLGFLSTRCRRYVCACAAIVLWPASPALAQSADNVAVVINDNSPDSKQIGEHYARTRSLPVANVIRISVAPDESVERATYLSSIEAPIAAAIRRGGLHDRVLYLVLTKGVPLRIAGTAGVSGTLASVDSELTLLYRKMTGRAVASAGKIDNPYYLGSRQPRDALPFSHREHDIYLVTRLDASTAADAMALVDRAQSPGKDGQIVLDQRDADTGAALHGWMAEAAKRLAAEGHGTRVVLEQTSAAARADAPVMGLYSWGAADPSQRRRTTGMNFTPGAIAAFASASDTLTADLIGEGITGAAGHVAEPYLLGAVRPEILFPAYLAGFNLAEAFYLATPALSWTTIVVGDPLCRPFSGKLLTGADLESAIDSTTGLPRLFSERRVAHAASGASGMPQQTAVHMVHAETLLTRGDRAGARKALEQAVALAPNATGLLINLAQLEEGDGLYDAAIARYRRIIELQPGNVVALNNLAFALAVYGKAPADALPLARRAAAIAPGSASVLDTLAWTEHLLGNHATAMDLLTRAIKIDPAMGEVRLHAAEVAASLGDRARAETELKEALRVAPSLEQQDGTRRLRERIEALPPKKS